MGNFFDNLSRDPFSVCMGQFDEDTIENHVALLIGHSHEIFDILFKTQNVLLELNKPNKFKNIPHCKIQTKEDYKHVYSFE